MVKNKELKDQEKEIEIENEKNEKEEKKKEGPKLSVVLVLGLVQIRRNETHESTDFCIFYQQTYTCPCMPFTSFFFFSYYAIR